MKIEKEKKLAIVAVSVFMLFFYLRGKYWCETSLVEVRKDGCVSEFNYFGSDVHNRNDRFTIDRYFVEENGGGLGLDTSRVKIVAKVLCHDTTGERFPAFLEDDGTFRARLRSKVYRAKADSFMKAYAPVRAEAIRQGDERLTAARRLYNLQNLGDSLNVIWNGRGSDEFKLGRIYTFLEGVGKKTERSPDHFRKEADAPVFTEFAYTVFKSPVGGVHLYRGVLSHYQPLYLVVEKKGDKTAWQIGND